MANLGLSLTKCLAGSLLISMPGRDTHPLEECVIYIYEHSPQLGAQGIVINRQSGVTVETLLERMKFAADGSLSALQKPLYHGGLEDENGVIMLHSSEWYSSNTRAVSCDISVSSDTFMLEKLVMGNMPTDWILCAGKCDWLPGRLEKEVASNKWLTVPAANQVIFSDMPAAKQWRQAIDYCTEYTVKNWF